MRLGQYFALEEDVSCPHCRMNGRGSCHVCNERRRISLRKCYGVMQWAWASPNCRCDACREWGPRPVDSPSQAALRSLH